MNIIELKKKYNSVFKLKIEGMDIYYRRFNTKEIILLQNKKNEDIYKYEITREAVINKENYDAIEKWQSKEIIYNNINKISIYNKDDLIAKKIEIKEQLNDNIFLVFIKNIIAILPTLNINELLECNLEQLLFYVVLCEEISGKKILDTDPLKSSLKNPIPVTSTQKKAKYTSQDLIDISMQSSTDALSQHLAKYGKKPKIFNKEYKKDPFEE